MPGHEFPPDGVEKLVVVVTGWSSSSLSQVELSPGGKWMDEGCNESLGFELMLEIWGSN